MLQNNNGFGGLGFIFALLALFGQLFNRPSRPSFPPPLGLPAPGGQPGPLGLPAPDFYGTPLGLPAPPYPVGIRAYDGQTPLGLPAPPTPVGIRAYDGQTPLGLPAPNYFGTPLGLPAAGTSPINLPVAREMDTGETIWYRPAYIPAMPE